MKNFKKIAVSLVCSLLIASTQAKRMMQEKPTKTVTETIRSNPELNSFYADLQAKGLTQTLDGKCNFTVFAPNNKAFMQLPANAVKPAELKAVLQHHIALGKYSIKQLEVTPRLETLQRTNHSTLHIKYMHKAKPHEARPMIKTNQKDASGALDKKHKYAHIIGEPIKASNGIIYIIDEVLVLPSRKGKSTKQRSKKQQVVCEQMQ